MFVPPSVDQLPVCLDALEKFFHEQSQDMPPLIKAGLIHVQFETIHPFLDGNGRLGRLLITLLLSAEKVLAQPLLYLSLYFKLHREDYYRLLQEVRDRGAWEAWLDFFLTGVASTADQAYNSAIRLLDLFEADRKKIASGGDRAGSTLRLHEALRKSPYLNAQKAAKITELSMPTVNSALAELQRLSIIKEVTGKRRNRVYAYSAYLSILAEGAEPIR